MNLGVGPCRLASAERSWARAATTAVGREHAACGALLDAIPIATGLILLLAWDFTNMDLVVTHWFGDAHGFYWRDHWLTAALMHVGVEYAAWLVFALLVVGIWRPLALTQRLTRREHVWCVANAMLCIVVITMLKRISATSCPWDLAEFGGALGHYVPHWLFGQHDGGPGGCFPSAHASCAFAFLAGPYLLRRHAAAAARRVALLIATTGFLLGLVQVMRGAHYASHALWTGWICWCVTALSFHASRPWLNGTNTPACRPTPLPPSGWSDTLPFAFAPSEPSEGPPTTHARTRSDCIARPALRLDRSADRLTMSCDWARARP